MSKLLLYTVQGKKDKCTSSMADKHGLTAYLGYRPVFCTRIEPESLSESWFRIWAAAPGWPERICIFEIEESECIPMNVVDWTNTCLKMDNPTDEQIKAILNADHPDKTDYLVKEIPDECLEIPIAALYLDKNMFARLFKLNETDGVVKIFNAAQESIDRVMDSLYESVDGRKNSDKTYENIYGAIRLTGLVPFLWMLASKKGIPDTVIAIQPEYFQNPSFMRAQDLLSEWDMKIQIPKSKFTYEEYDEMRKKFIDGLNIAAKESLNKAVKRLNIGANDSCICGSGKKYKRCHKNATIDEMVANPINKNPKENEENK
jgi:hypothetical protein